MKLYKFSLAFTLIFFVNSVFSQIELPAPSPLGTVSQKVGLTDILIEYSRPGVKDRKIFGDLVAYDKLWRTGANKVSKITFSTEVIIEGEKVGPGSYAIFTIPGKDSWTFILNKNTEQWGTGSYEEDQDALRVKIEPEKTCFTETMTFLFNSVKDDGAKLELRWDEILVPIEIKTEFHETALSNIEAAIAKIEQSHGTYNSAARYYLNSGEDAEKALKWTKKSIEINKRFWNLKTHAEALAANGKYKEAIKTAKESIELAEEAGNSAYVNMNEENIEKWKKMD